MSATWWARVPHETGIAASDCAEHAGLHVYEDLCVLEVVDDAYRPVPAGQVGTRVLVTNLYNRTLPMIRMEVPEVLTRCAPHLEREAGAGKLELVRALA